MYIITGCSSGLGYEIAAKLLLNKHKVVGLSRGLGKASDFSNDVNFTHVKCNLALEEDFEELDQVLDFGKGGISLILNAGMFEYEGDDLSELGMSKTIFNVNYFSATSLVKKFVEKGLVRVLFINSISGKAPQLGQGQYSASKHALQSYSETLAKFSVGRDFDVMSINPGGIDSELWENTDLLTKNITDKFIQPKSLAKLVYAFLKLPPKTYIKYAAILPEHDV
jgi:3-oxoacyl-[acyl-carrier protein] reductase